MNKIKLVLEGDDGKLGVYDTNPNMKTEFLIMHKNAIYPEGYFPTVVDVYKYL